MDGPLAAAMEQPYIDPQRAADALREQSDRRSGKGTGLGGVSREVQAARAAAFAAALSQRTAHLRDPYQLELRLPGFNPTLMALRSREPLTPEDVMASGLAFRGFQPTTGSSSLDSTAWVQPEFDLRGMAPAANQVVGFQRAAAPAQEARAARRFAGMELSRLLAYALAGSGGLLGGGLALVPDSEVNRS